MNQALSPALIGWAFCFLVIHRQPSKFLHIVCCVILGVCRTGAATGVLFGLDVGVLDDLAPLGIVALDLIEGLRGSQEFCVAAQLLVLLL